MSADRKTGKIEIDLGGPIELQVNFSKVAELEKKTGKGIYDYAQTLYQEVMSVTESARLFSVLAVSPKLTEEQWGNRIWENRKGFSWVEFVLDFCEIVFDADMRGAPTEQEKKDQDQPEASTGTNSSEQPSIAE